MSRKVFTAGEVLAAADVNSFLMDQTVMSFAGTAARGSAIPTPVTGMYTHLEDSGSLQYWNGSAWRSPDGLALLGSQSFTSATEVIFNTVFSSLYTNYIFDLEVTSSSVNADFQLQLRNGTTNAAASYFSTNIFTVHTSTTVSSGNQTNQSGLYFNSAGLGHSCSTRINFFQPNLAELTHFTSHGFNRFGGDYAQRIMGGVHGDATAYNGFRVFTSAGNFNGRARIYGVRI